MKRLLIFLILIFFTFSQDIKAPDFTARTLSNKNLQLSKELGNGPIVINFWATWCAPCLKEMKKMKPIYEQYKNKGLKIFSVSIDDANTVNRLKSFVKSRKFPYEILLDTDQSLKRLFNVANPPYTLLLDKNGKIVYKHSGYVEGDEVILEKKIEELYRM